MALVGEAAGEGRLGRRHCRPKHFTRPGQTNLNEAGMWRGAEAAAEGSGKLKPIGCAGCAGKVVKAEWFVVMCLDVLHRPLRDQRSSDGCRPFVLSQVMAQ